MFIFIAGITPTHECKSLSNESAYADYFRPNSSLSLVYGKCTIDVYDNSTNYTHVTQMSCVNGYTYGQPRETSFVSEVTTHSLLADSV
jgi:hypothetical protein